jgi:hypothetical protein
VKLDLLTGDIENVDCSIGQERVGTKVHLQVHAIRVCFDLCVF